MSPTAEQARTVEVLRGARGLIADPERWTRQTNARDANGDAIHPCQSGATRWCASGALIRAAARGHVLGEVKARRALEAATPLSLVSVNDKCGHQRVLALFDWAIARLEKTA